MRQQGSVKVQRGAGKNLDGVDMGESLLPPAYLTGSPPNTLMMSGDLVIWQPSWGALTQLYTKFDMRVRRTLIFRLAGWTVLKDRTPRLVSKRTGTRILQLVSQSSQIKVFTVKFGRSWVLRVGRKTRADETDETSDSDGQYRLAQGWNCR